MHLNDWIIDNLKKAEFSTSITEELYKQLLPEFGVHYKYDTFSRHVRRVKQRYFESHPEELIERNITDESEEDTESSPSSNKAMFEEEGNKGCLTFSTSEEVKDIDSLVKDCGIDLEAWKISKHTVNRWETLIKTEKGYEKKPIYQVKAHLDRVVPVEVNWPSLRPLNMPEVRRITSKDKNSSKVTNYLIISDTQIGFSRTDYVKLEPFHDRKAMDSVLKLLEDNPTFFDEIIVNGDVLDLASMSKYTQKKEFTDTVQPTIIEAGWYFEQLRRLAPHAPIIYTASNHDERINKYIMENIQIAYGLKAYGQKNPLFSLQNLLGLDNIDVHYVEGYPGGSYWILGRNNKPLIKIHHGEFTSIDKELSVTNVSSIFGHVHQIATKCKTYHGGNGPETVYVATSGCLCRIDGTVPGVVSRPSWQQGIIHLEVTDTDDFSINHLPINDGRLLFRGKIYQGNYYEVPGLT